MNRAVTSSSYGRGRSANGSLRKSSRNRRKTSLLTTRLFLVVFIAFAVVVIVVIHVFLFRAISSKETETIIRLPSSFSQQIIQPVTLAPLRDVDLELYTIRINTWQRLEQLLVSIEHHATCKGAAQIQVVWCEDTDPPLELIHSHDKVVVERHKVNSLNERFHIIEEAPTLGILSIDDDVLRPCEAIDSGFFKWTQNPHRMVGFDARTHVAEDDGTWKYGYMSTTEKSNKYSLSLPRYCFVHADYLKSYMTQLPRPIFNHVHEVFNCEDIAMSFWISRLTGGKPPLLADMWAMKSMVKLYSPETISGTKNHKKLRDACIDDFANQLGLKDMLQKATIVHNKKEHLFDSGAQGSKEPPEHWRLVERNANLQTKVRHWKHISTDKAVKEITNLKNHMMRHPYVLGLIADTPPWKKRWNKR